MTVLHAPLKNSDPVVVGILEKRDLGLGPDPREKPDPGPLGKKRTLGLNKIPDPWTLWKNRTLDKNQLSQQ